MASAPKATRCTRRRLAALAARSALLAVLGGLARQSWLAAARAFLPPPPLACNPLGQVAPALAHQPHRRRDAVLAAGLPGLAVGGVADLRPAHALFGFFEKPWVAYTLLNAVNISMPPDYNLTKRDDPGFLVWQGDRIQRLEQMTASAKVVGFPDLASALKGQNITQVGLELAQKRKAGAAQLVEAKRDPAEAGLDVWQFEFDGEKLHEVVLYGLVRRGSDNVLVSVCCRTPRMLWEDRRERFNQIAASFAPLEPQPNRTSGFLAEDIELQSFYEAASTNATAR